MTAALMILTTATTQVVSKDSMNMLKQQKETLDLHQQLNDSKLKLAKLENSLERQSADMVKAQEEAQKSADANAEIANRLSADASDRKLARKAKKAARSAERYARQARQEAGNLESLQKDIDSLKKQIAGYEEKLASLPSVREPVTRNN
ncbi:MAG: hypothetical protein JWM28_873 [Chitinophagaceae bacterium]|nr:hypothetical protein [Chitinophagaceae bacterium]